MLNSIVEFLAFPGPSELGSELFTVPGGSLFLPVTGVLLAQQVNAVGVQEYFLPALAAGRGNPSFRRISIHSSQNHFPVSLTGFVLVGS